MNQFTASLRLAATTLVVCCVLYPALIFGFARLAAPDSAEGSLVRRADGTVIGSRFIAQAFVSPEYFWPRPSAVDFHAAAAGGSNLSPAGEKVRERGIELVARFGATTARPLPADLAAASGSGLDPNISRAAAEFQTGRVAAARGLNEATVQELVRSLSRPVAAFDRSEVLNVLELNLALDRLAADR